VSSGGHGGGWIVTYCDMITLLMAGFIVIVTFNAHDAGKASQRKDSVVGRGGSGVAGLMRTSPDKDSVLLRLPPMSGRAKENGSMQPPLYSDFPWDEGKALKNLIDSNQLAKLSESYEIAFPQTQMFESPDKLSTKAEGVLARMAAIVRKLPFDIQIQVSDPTQLTYAQTIYHRLFEVDHIHPARLSIGIRPANDDKGKFWLILRRVA
jgi:flagellar motor protein MotB